MPSENQISADSSSLANKSKISGDEGDSKRGRDEDSSQSAKALPKRKRISQACDACNKRKVKCDGSRPCLNCRKMGVFCTISRTDYRHLRADYVRRLEDKLRHLEQQTQTAPSTAPHPAMIGSPSYTDSQQPQVYAPKYAWTVPPEFPNPNFSSGSNSPTRSSSAAFDGRVPGYPNMGPSTRLSGHDVGANASFNRGADSQYFMMPATSSYRASPHPNPPMVHSPHQISSATPQYRYYSRPVVPGQPMELHMEQQQARIPHTATATQHALTLPSPQHFSQQQARPSYGNMPNYPGSSSSLAPVGDSKFGHGLVNPMANGYGSDSAHFYSHYSPIPRNVATTSPFISPPPSSLSEVTARSDARVLSGMNMSMASNVRDRKERSPSPTLNVSYSADATKFMDVGNLADINDKSTGLPDDSSRHSLSSASPGQQIASSEFSEEVKSFPVTTLFSLSYERNMNIPDGHPLAAIKEAQLKCALFPELPLEALQELVICYFRYYNLYVIPILRVQDILEDLDSVNPFLLNSIYLLGSRFARHPALIKLGSALRKENPSVYGVEDAEIQVQYAVGDAFFNFCRPFILDAIEAPTLQRLISTLHCAYYHANIGKRAAAFMFFGMVTRMAFEMKLNDDRFNVASVHSGSSLVTKPCELRRRVFWLLYAMDRYWAILFERPLGIRDNDCYVQYPEFDTQWYKSPSLPRMVAVPEHIRRILHCPYVYETVNKAMRDAVVPSRPSPTLVFDAGIKMAMKLKPELTLETAYQAVLQCSIRGSGYFVPAVPFVTSVFTLNISLIKIYGRIGRLIGDCNKTKVMLAMDFSSWTTLRTQGVDFGEPEMISDNADVPKKAAINRIIWARKRRLLSNLVEPELTDLMSKLSEIQLSLQMWYAALPDWIKTVPNRYHALGGSRSEPPVVHALLLMKYYVLVIISEKLKHRLRILREDLLPSGMREPCLDTALAKKENDSCEDGVVEDGESKAVHAHESEGAPLCAKMCQRKSSVDSAPEQSSSISPLRPHVARAEFSTVMLLGLQFVSTRKIVRAAIATTEIVVRLLDILPETFMISPIVGWSLFHAGSVHLGRYLQLMNDSGRRRFNVGDVQKVIKRYIDLHLVCLQGAGRYWAVSWQLYKLFRGMVSAVFSVKSKSECSGDSAGALAKSSGSMRGPMPFFEPKPTAVAKSANDENMSKSEPFIAVHDGPNQKIDSTLLLYPGDSQPISEDGGSVRSGPSGSVLQANGKNKRSDDANSHGIGLSNSLYPPKSFGLINKEASPATSDTFLSDLENGFENYQLSSTENAQHLNAPVLSSLLDQSNPQQPEDAVSEDVFKDFAAAALTFFNPEFDSLPSIVPSATDLTNEAGVDLNLNGIGDDSDDRRPTAEFPEPNGLSGNLGLFDKPVGGFNAFQEYPKMAALLSLSGFVDDVSILNNVNNIDSAGAGIDTSADSKKCNNNPTSSVTIPAKISSTT